jgi:hypothetical protein
MERIEAKSIGQFRRFVAIDDIVTAAANVRENLEDAVVAVATIF